MPPDIIQAEAASWRRLFQGVGCRNRPWTAHAKWFEVQRFPDEVTDER